MASARIPADPGGPGHFHSAALPGGEPQPFDTGSPAARQAEPRPAPAPSSTSIWQVIRAESWDQLKSLALALLGPASHELGLCYGLVEGGWGIIAGLLDLLKMVVLEGLYKQAHHPWSWSPLELPDHLQGRLADYLMHSQLEAAHRQFRALIDQFHLVVAHPLDFFGGVWRAEAEEYTEKWQRYKWLHGHRTLANEFEAGRMEGETLLEVVLLLATVVDGAGLALKGAKALGEIPELARLARSVRSVEAKAVLEERRLDGFRAGAGTVEEADGAAGSSAARSPTAAGARTWEYQPKQTGRIEPGAVPTTPELQQSFTESLRRTAPTAPDGWPPLSDDIAATFGGTPQAQNIASGTKLYRVIGSDRSASGSFWSFDPPPATEADWRGPSAVKDAWNGDGGYVEHTVGPDGLKAWTGPIAPQQAAVDGYMLPGGGQQIWVPPGTLAPGGPAQATPWNLAGGSH